MGADTKVSKVRVGEGFGCRDSQTRLERQHPAQQVGCLQMVDVLKIVIFKTGNDSLKLPAILVTQCIDEAVYCFSRYLIQTLSVE